MANYGRGWNDGYGSQSADAIDAYQRQEAIEAGQIQNAMSQRKRDMEAETYGRTKLSKLRAAVQALRDAIRSGDPEAIEAAWDRCEPWIDRIFVPN